MFFILSHQLQQQPQILYRIDTVPVQVTYGNMRDLTHCFGVGNKLIHRSHDDDLVSFRYKLANDVQPEIVNIPGGVGDDGYFFWVHLLLDLLIRFAPKSPEGDLNND